MLYFHSSQLSFDDEYNLEQGTFALANQPVSMQLSFHIQNMKHMFNRNNQQYISYSTSEVLSALTKVNVEVDVHLDFEHPIYFRAAQVVSFYGETAIKNYIEMIYGGMVDYESL